MGKQPTACDGESVRDVGKKGMGTAQTPDFRADLYLRYYSSHV